MRYLLAVAGDQSFEDIRTRVIEVAPATEVTMATAAEQLIQHGRTLGKAEGKAEGVLAVLEARGLSVSAEQRARIVGCKDIAKLDRWLRLATTRSVEELFSH